MQATYEPYILSKFGENLTLIQEVIKYPSPGPAPGWATFRGHYSSDCNDHNDFDSDARPGTAHDSRGTAVHGLSFEGLSVLYWLLAFGPCRPAVAARDGRAGHCQGAQGAVPAHNDFIFIVVIFCFRTCRLY